MALEEGRKWEKLPKDCLVAILGGVGIESLLFDVPLVCKSWYHASRDPTCWQILDFSKMNRPSLMQPTNSNFLPYSDVITFIKSVVDRSCKLAVKFVLPSNCYGIVGEILEYISNECPDLKYLFLPCYLQDYEQKLLSDLIFKWKKLEILWVRTFSLLVEIFTQIELNCNNFVGILCYGCNIPDDVALALISIPGIKYLRLKGCYVARDVVEMIIVNCKNLEMLDARDCIGFKGDDGDLLNLASHIKYLKFEGSVLYEEDEGDDYIDHDDMVYDQYLLD